MSWDLRGPPEPLVCWGSILPEHRAELIAALPDTVCPVTGRCHDVKRQTLVPLCREEGEETPLRGTVEEDMVTKPELLLVC